MNSSKKIVSNFIGLEKVSKQHGITFIVLNTALILLWLSL